jgi:hypothetical protein
LTVFGAVINIVVPEIPTELPKTLTVRFGDSLTRQIFAFTSYTDVIYSRLVKRAVENELARRSKTDPKLKQILEKVKNAKPTRNSRP